MRVTSMANLGFNITSNNYTKIKEGTIKKLASNGGLSLLANKIKKISNSAIAFVKKKGVLEILCHSSNILRKRNDTCPNSSISTQH